MLELDFKNDRDLIMVTLDSLISLLEKRRNVLPLTELCRLIARHKGLLQALINLIPKLIKQADNNQFRHGISEILGESGADTSMASSVAGTQEEQAEKYLGRAFEII